MSSLTPVTPETFMKTRMITVSLIAAALIAGSLPAILQPCRAETSRVIGSPYDNYRQKSRSKISSGNAFTKTGRSLKKGAVTVKDGAAWTGRKVANLLLPGWAFFTEYFTLNLDNL